MRQHRAMGSASVEVDLPDSRVMDLRGLSFVWTARIEPERDSCGEPLEFLPQSRYANSASSRLHPHGGGPFGRFKLHGLPSSSCLYVVTLEGELAYVGIAGNFAVRWRSGNSGRYSRATATWVSSRRTAGSTISCSRRRDEGAESSCGATRLRIGRKSSRCCSALSTCRGTFASDDRTEPRRHSHQGQAPRDVLGRAVLVTDLGAVDNLWASYALLDIYTLLGVPLSRRGAIAIQ